MVGMMASGGINLLPDTTLLFQFIIFLCVVMVVNIFVIRPTLAILRCRQERTVGNAERAASLERKAAEETQELEAKLDAARRETLASEEIKRRDVEAQTSALVADARRRAEDRLEGERSGLADLARRAQVDANATVPELASLIMTQVVGANGKGEG